MHFSKIVLAILIQFINLSIFESNIIFAKEFDDRFMLRHPLSNSKLLLIILIEIKFSKVHLIIGKQKEMQFS
jgi:hypothetical protein